MCGTVGMFVGCTAMESCPLGAFLAATPPAAGGDADGATAPYSSALDGWHERASIRVAPRRTIDPAEGDAFYFSPDLVPIARHLLIRRLPDATFREILIQHLFRYLDFTAKLESLVINRTILAIAHGSVGLWVPEPMRFDALKLYCDEAYHTLFSVDLARQVRDRTGLPARTPQ